MSAKDRRGHKEGKDKEHGNTQQTENTTRHCGQDTDKKNAILGTCHQNA